VIPHLQERLHHGREPELFLSWPLKRDERMQLARSDLILFK